MSALLYSHPLHKGCILLYFDPTQCSGVTLWASLDRASIMWKSSDLRTNYLLSIIIIIIMIIIIIYFHGLMKLVPKAVKLFHVWWNRSVCSTRQLHQRLWWTTLFSKMECFESLKRQSQRLFFRNGVFKTNMNHVRLPIMWRFSQELRLSSSLSVSSRPAGWTGQWICSA